MKIEGHTFLVTGGSSGLGEACVRRLVQLGARVVIADMDEGRGRSLVEELDGERTSYMAEKAGGTPAPRHNEVVRLVHTDVTREEDVQAAVRVAVKLSVGDGLRGLVNCAGIVAGHKVVGKTGPHPLESFAKLINVNLVGTFNAIRLAASAMAEALPAEGGERGVIINTASIAAFEGQIGQAAYAASKGGVVSMTLPIARELAAHGIRVVTVAPGMFDTPMMAGVSEKAREALLQSTVCPPRLGRPEEFAALVAQIIENQMLNGCVIRLDGGVRLAAK